MELVAKRDLGICDIFWVS